MAMALLIFASACGFQLPALGLAGKYRQGRSLLLKPNKGVVAPQVIPFLEEVARKDPFYQDTLTLLGQAYYHTGNYQDAFQILQRALIVNKNDEIAWLALGLTQLRLGKDQEGFESLKNGVALLNKLSRHGYRGHPSWDPNRLVSSAIRRTIALISTDGLAKKEDLIRAGELVLRRVDDEELSQQTDARIKEKREALID